MASESYKKRMAMVYGLGGAVVIIGALFKLMHWPGGGIMLILGLGTEAMIFTISAFEKQEKEVDWSIVYPELNQEEDSKDKKVVKKKVESVIEKKQGPISDKVDELFDAANIDVALLDKLAGSIRGLSNVASNISSTVDAVSYTQKYVEELSLAAERVKSLNGVYKLQLENTNNQAAINEEITNVTSRVKQQMDSLASNLSSLNGVYGGMLSAMNVKK